MLEDYEKKDFITKEEYKDRIDGLRLEMTRLQQQVMQEKLPVTIVFEGWGAAGKGGRIGDLIFSMDPRGFKVHNMSPDAEDDAMFSDATKYLTKMPKYGEIAIFNRSWYRPLIRNILANNKKKTAASEFEARAIESQAVRDGGVVIKFFLHITKKEQKRRFKKLMADPDARWRITERDAEQNKHYDEYLDTYEKMLEATDYDFAPWSIINATDRRSSIITIYETVIDRLHSAFAAHEERTAAVYTGEADLMPSRDIREIDKDATVAPDEYITRLKELQERAGMLHNMLYKKRVPVIICYEGWDAAGKGGNIKRLTRGLDPRGYEVFPIAAPDATELSHQYLWRFCNRLPKAGHISVFDRTWYGRVMVERIEGITPEVRWKDAYGEINEFERMLTDWGAVIIKFYINIDKDEQLRRFEDRKNTPDKQWKLTDEDWRNRDKWPQYEEAVNDMLRYTNTPYAPWHIIQSEDKKYARLETLGIFIDAVEDRLKL